MLLIISGVEKRWQANALQSQFLCPNGIFENFNAFSSFTEAAITPECHMCLYS